MKNPHKPTAADRRSFVSAANRLAKLGRKGLYIYLAEDALNLLSGPSHDHQDGRDKPRQDRVVEQVYIPGAGGGDW
jgi:hypothetical protein